MIYINTKKILIIDDEEEILTLLKVVLNKEGFCNIRTVQDSLLAIQVCKEYSPDIIILDIMMPDKDGYAVLADIRRITTAPVLFLSAKEHEANKVLGLKLGADDYITKPFSPIEVAYRVKAHLRRKEIIVNELINKQRKIVTNDFEVDFNCGKVYRGSKEYSLRAKELKLLWFLISNKNTILSKTDLIKAVWGEDYNGFDNTLMVHIRKLREKIEVNPSKPKYIVNLKGLGYMFVNK